MTITNKDMMIDTSSKIYVAGHHGMVGSAIVRQLQAKGYKHLLLLSRAELDLTNQMAVRDFLIKKNLIMFFSSCKSWWNSRQ